MAKIPAKQSGFTIVELLIVIVVIGILAAITIATFNGVQERARTSALKSEMSQLQKKIQVDVLQGGGEAVSIKAPLAYMGQPGSNSPLTEPIKNGQEATLYAVFDTTNDLTSSWSGLAQLNPSVQSDNKLQLRTNGSGGTEVNGSYSTSTHSDQSISVGNIRNTTGRHAGWVTATPGVFMAGFDSSTEATSRVLSAHNGWNFTTMSVFAPSGGVRGVAAIVFPEFHNEAARKQVLRWLDQEYTIDYYN